MLGFGAMEGKGGAGATGRADESPLAAMLAAQGVVILDGGLATQLEARGHELSHELWSARLLADQPGEIRAVHLDYLAAGADILITSSYQATIDGFRRAGRSVREALELVLSATHLARQARERFWSEPANRRGRLRPLVAASVGPYGAARADGSEFTGDYGLDEADLVRFHRPRLALLARSGAELLACETIPSRVEARALARLLRERPAVWAWLSFTCRDGERLRDGTDFAAAVAEVEALSNLAAVGVNCTAPEHVAELVERARAATEKPIVVYPNSGEAWDAARRAWIPGERRPDLAAASVGWRDLGARLVGGCCRVGPAEIAAIRQALLGAREGAAPGPGTDFD
jgi:homocysteine S-methyltransferase